ncbi:type I restriction-modification system subunit M [Cellulomonas timonensis]|uniref:type I restriction-modification system subunit M n=1 Tax=Cellulomonas timonensis TaxID=1689271 RepID=UPI0028FCEF0B|nr:class I SAM-dependent DNA methyltransferase [Cellulomonas timonensis]
MEARPVNGYNDMVGFIWSVADLLRGDYKQAEYGKVILPLTVLRRLDCVLEPTKPAVLAKVKALGEGVGNVDPILRRAAGQPFYNVSPLDFRGLLADPEHIARSLRLYIDAFSPGAVEVLDKYGFDAQITKLDEAGLLYQVVARFADVDLHPDKVTNLQMGYLFEELIRKFSEAGNETAGEHFTPREVIRLMVNLLLDDDDSTLATPGIVKTIYDPACGTGGMLSTAEDWIREHNPAANLELFGQELNPETYAVCRSDMMLKGHNAQNIALGNSFSHDAHADKSFDYMLANPPFGVEWKKVQTFVEDEAARGYAGRFGAGTPRINDGSLLFLQHMIAKMKPLSEGGSRLAIVFNGSPLFTGAAGSGESEIRRWILENDWLEGIVALPDQLFYNTGISTYFWILSNRKRPEHKGQVVLLDARDQFTKMRKSLGDKRKETSPDQIAQITRWYADALDTAADPESPDHARVKVLPTTAFGYQRITVERPLRLRFEVTDDAIETVRASKPFRALAPADQERLTAALGLLLPDGGAEVDGSTRKTFQAGLKAALVSHGAPTFAALDKVLWAAVSTPDPEGELQTDRHGHPLPDPDLRDNENVPLGEDVDDYLAREVLPHVPDAWIDHTKTKTGYEIPFTRHFYVYTPPRPLAEIDAELKALEAEIQRLLGEVTA